MRFLVLSCLCLIALLAIAPFARAQTRVFHCVGAHGEPVFSGQPCGDPVAPPTLMGASNANTRNFVGTFAGSRGGVCAGSPAALRHSIAGAFANRDVNRLAGLILWRGIDQSSARQTLRSLTEWLKQPLVGIASASAAGPPYADDDALPLAPSSAVATVPVAAPQVPGGFEVSTGGADGRTRDFGVTEFGGCWWLTF